MPRKPLETLSEPMFYILMALRRQPLCGADIAAWVLEKTGERIKLGPGTLYTILPRLTQEGILQEVETEGRRRSYVLTEKGFDLYEAECRRLRRCVADLEAESTVWKKEA